MARPRPLRVAAAAVAIAVALGAIQALYFEAGPRAGVRMAPLAGRAEAAYKDVLGQSRAPVVEAWQPPRPATILVQPPAQTVIPTGRSSIHLPILMYHYIRVNPDPRDQLGFNLSVTPDDFNRQLDWLAGNGYHPVTFDDVRAYFAGRQPLPEKPIVLTFDDGYRDFYTTALPALKAHRFRAVSYVVTGFIGGPNYMTWDMVKEIEASGVEIGAHTFSHIDLTKASPPELQRQLVDSEQTFQAELGHPVVDFCYPSGRFNATVVAAVQAAGYQTATTTQPGADLSWSGRYTWTRVRVSGGEPLSSLIADLGTPEASVTEPPPPAYIRFPALQRVPLKYGPQPAPPPPALAVRLLLP